MLLREGSLKNWDITGILKKRFSRRILNTEVVGTDWLLPPSIHTKYNSRPRHYLVREIPKIYWRNNENYSPLNKDNRRGTKECTTDSKTPNTRQRN